MPDDQTEPPEPRFEVAAGAQPHAVAEPSPLVLEHLHLGAADVERGAPGMGIGD